VAGEFGGDVSALTALAHGLPLPEKIPEGLLEGFSLQEWAEYLGRVAYYPQLGIPFRHAVRVWEEGEIHPLARPQFEARFGLRYLERYIVPHSTVLHALQEECPWRWRREAKPLLTGVHPALYLKWMDELIEWGVFADEELREGEWIGEYVGQIRPVVRGAPYGFHYPTKWRSYHPLMIDARLAGNETRFLNHSCAPNLRIVCQADRQLLHFGFFTNQVIPAEPNP